MVSGTALEKSNSSSATDPQFAAQPGRNGLANRCFATLNCRGAKGLFDHVVGADERRDRHGNSVNAAALCASINDDESASITSARFSHCYDDGKSVYVHGVHTGGTISP